MEELSIRPSEVETYESQRLKSQDNMLSLVVEEVDKNYEP